MNSIFFKKLGQLLNDNAATLEKLCGCGEFRMEYMQQSLTRETMKFLWMRSRSHCSDLKEKMRRERERQAKDSIDKYTSDLGL